MAFNVFDTSEDRFAHEKEMAKRRRDLDRRIRDVSGVFDDEDWDDLEDEEFDTFEKFRPKRR